MSSPQLHDFITLRWDCPPFKRGDRCVVKIIYPIGRDKYVVEGPSGHHVTIPIEAIEKN